MKADPKFSFSRLGTPVRTILVLALLLLINYIGGTLYYRFDLTEDHRYTLSEVSERAFNKLEGTVYIRTFLGGDLPLEFVRLRKGVTELLEEYGVRSGRKIEFLHEDPNQQGQNQQELQTYRQELLRHGIEAITVYERNASGLQSERVIFPGLCASYGGQTVYVNLLRHDVTLTNEENITQSLQRLEYELTATLYKLLQRDKLPVGFTTSHDELAPQQTASWRKELAQRFVVYPYDSLQEVGMLDSCKFVVVANPQQPFTELEKLVLDQYVMRGGNLLFFLNPVATSVDSLQQHGRTFAMPIDLNLEDLLFRYGVRISTRLLQDAQCAPIPVNMAVAGQAARFTPLPWIYYPLLTPQAFTYLSRNVPLVYSRFPVALELTRANDSILKVPFLTSSKYARVTSSPQIIELSEIKNDPRAREMPLQNVPVGVLLEGKFASVFAHRPLRTIAPGQLFTFRAKSSGARIVVFGDGRIAANDISYKNGRERILPLGFDKYTQQTFGNRELLENIVLYLSGNEALLRLRGREYASQLLDAHQLQADRWWLLVANIVIPLLLLLLMGGTWWFVRILKRF
ncbi:MAG: gliding motility-associated ABC transporter substrate-binding protein GldG [Bacteroides sp.]